jgi:hypothetical protein
MNTKAKGRRGHELAKKWLEAQGWSVYVCPHTQVEWRSDGIGGKQAQWNTSGFNDAFSIPTGDGNKRKGGFDIIALRELVKADGTKILRFSLWQVKKTKKSPFSYSLKETIKECAGMYKLPLNTCNIIWWPDGVGLERGEPVVWRADG